MNFILTYKCKIPNEYFTVHKINDSFESFSSYLFIALYWRSQSVGEVLTPVFIRCFPTLLPKRVYNLLMTLTNAFVTAILTRELNALTYSAQPIDRVLWSRVSIKTFALACIRTNSCNLCTLVCHCFHCSGHIAGWIQNSASGGRFICIRPYMATLCGEPRQAT